MSDLSSLTVPELVETTRKYLNGVYMRKESEDTLAELARRADSAEALAEALERIIDNPPASTKIARDALARYVLARYRGEK